MNLRKLTTDGLKELAMEDLRTVVRDFLRAGLAAHGVIGQLLLIRVEHSAAATEGLEEIAKYMANAQKHLKRATAAWGVVSERAAEERKAKRQ